MELGEYVTSAIEETVDFTRAVERVIAAKRMVGAALPPLRALLDLQGDLAPEVAATCDSLVEADAALDRAAAFLSARYDENMKRLNERLGTAP